MSIRAGVIVITSVLCTALSLLVALPSNAQPTGEVISIGFQQVIRPDAWIPILVRIRAGESDSGTYQLQIVQEDGDRDRVVFTRTISLTAGAGDQRFWAYFIPQSSRNRSTGNGGLPDVNAGATLSDLREHLKVYLADEEGKQINQLPLGALITDIEGPQDKIPARGTRMVLVVATGQAAPVYFPESSPQRTLVGTTENLVFVQVRFDDLPENVLGYDSVDAIVWADAPPPDPMQSSDAARLQALRQYVSGGGRLAVTHRLQWQELDRFGDMLPVSFPTIAGNRGGVRAPSLAPLADLPEVGPRWSRLPVPGVLFGLVDPLPNALTIVDGRFSETSFPGLPRRSSPLIVQRSFGSGSVSYVAFDPTDRNITSIVREGWPNFWDRVFDFRDDVRIINTAPNSQQTNPYPATVSRDLGAALTKYTELPARGAALIGIAVLFFVGYWIIAGPGSFWFLAIKKHAELNWFVFGGVALAATLLTLAVVRLVLRGGPQLSHISVVRVAEGQPAQVISRFGLYIPRDGSQKLEMAGSSPTLPATLSNMPTHWKHVDEASEFPAYLQYAVPVKDEAGVEPISIDVPYRSTLKKFEARWRGELQVGISGTAALAPIDQGIHRLSGKLTSNFPTDLRDIYLAYTRPIEGFSRSRDHVFFIPVWKSGQSLDLQRLTLIDQSVRGEIRAISTDASELTGRPEDGKYRLYGYIGQPGAPIDWDLYWYAGLRRGLQQFDADFLDSQDGVVPRTFPMLSLFSRLPPMTAQSGGGTSDRADLVRRAARHLDVSAAVAGGSLVILARSDDSPLPFDFSVNGDAVTGSGRTYWQFVIPLDRSADQQPQSSTQPTQP